MYYDIEVLKYNKIWCRFDGKCWGECKSEYSDWTEFCSDKLHSLSRFEVDCSLLIGVGTCYQDFGYELEVAPVRVSVKFNSFPYDYEIEVDGKCGVSFSGGDRYEYENRYEYGKRPYSEDEVFGWLRKGFDSKYITQYIDDEVKYRLGLNDDGRLASEISDAIAHEVACEILIN